MTRNTAFSIFWIILGIFFLSYEVHLLMIGKASPFTALIAVLWAFIILSHILIINHSRHHHHHHEHYDELEDSDIKAYWHCTMCILTWQGEYEGEPIKSTGNVAVYCIVHDRPATHILTQPIDKPYHHGQPQEVASK